MVTKLSGLYELIASKPSPQPQPGDCHGRRASPLSQFQAGPHPALARHHTGGGKWTSPTPQRIISTRPRDCLLKRQGAIEKKLATQGILGRGRWCFTTSAAATTKAKPAHWLADTDTIATEKTGCPIIVYGVLTDADGWPVAASRCILAAPQTPRPSPIRSRRSRSVSACLAWCWLAIVACSHKLRLIRSKNTSGTQLDLCSVAAVAMIRCLLAKGHLIKKDLEAERLAEINSPDFPGERLVACYNSQLAEQRRHSRQELLAATQTEP